MSVNGHVVCIWRVEIRGSEKKGVCEWESKKNWFSIICYALGGVGIRGGEVGFGMGEQEELVLAQMLCVRGVDIRTEEGGLGMGRKRGIVILGARLRYSPGKSAPVCSR